MPKRVPWSTRVGRLLKGVGGVLTVLALISGIRSLSALWLEARDNDAATRSALEAAGLMAETTRFELAWAELDRASVVVSEPELLPYRAAVATQWVQWLGQQRTSQVDYTATVDRLLPYLYRALAEPGDLNPSDIQAHIAWATYLAAFGQDRVVDATELLQEAAARDNDNLYVQTLLGFFASMGGYETFEDVVARFAAGPPAETDRWASGMQLATFSNLLGNGLRRSSPHEVTYAIAREALPIAARHPKNTSFHSELTSWFSSLQRTEQVGLIDLLVGELEPQAFLPILEAAYRSRPIAGVARYLFGRLEEERGDLDAARAYLSDFHDGWARSARPELLALVQDAQARLGIALSTVPERGRNYVSDEMPPDVEPWRFHADTLRNFDYGFQTGNFFAAVDFFDTLPPDAITADTRAAVRGARSRVKRFIDEGERWLLETGGSESVEQDLLVPRENLAIVWYLVGRVAQLEGDLDAAITEWTDLYPRLTERVTLDWELAVAHAARSASEPALRQRDVAVAVRFLNEYVVRLRGEAQPVPWDDIRSEPAFASLSESPEFQALIRGRR